MAEDDIYGSKKRYENFKINLKRLISPGSDNYNRKYYCQYKDNLKYFKKLFTHFEASDVSFIRRLRALQTFKFVVHHIKKDLKFIQREESNYLMAMMHNALKSPRSKETFIRDLKYIWKILFPEVDQMGRPDETIVPWVVRHISPKIDKSRQKFRKDKLSWEEFEKIVEYFSNDPRIQAYLTLSLESLARPQELLYRKISEIEHFDTYGKILLSDHGKEGPGFLQCIDSYPYLLKWLSVHPAKDNMDSYIFINIGSKKTLKQLKPANINNLIRKACQELKIDKPITCYSLKRSGVTLRRLRGDTDLEIQHAARWTSTKQLKTYDLSNQDDAFKLALQKRGLITSDEDNSKAPESIKCIFCGEVSGFSESYCSKCNHPLKREDVLIEKAKDEKIEELNKTITEITSKFDSLKDDLLKDLAKQILEAKKSENVFVIDKTN